MQNVDSYKPIITVNSLGKSFYTAQKEPGMMGSLRSLVHRKYTKVDAVKNVSFNIEPGELVGFIGPNGAGKTTTLKMLSGLLCPSSGEVRVLGFNPFERETAYLKQVSLVMGQKNQLWWDLPAMDTFLLNKEIYDLSEKQFKQTLDELVSLLDVSSVLKTQVRKLSLGQRMKMELIAAIIHLPKVLFLDEPTIGLDVVMQRNLREFIRDYNRKHEATIILTSHYMDDVKSLCERVIIIDHGQVMYDGKLNKLVEELAPFKYITIELEKHVSEEELRKFGNVRTYEFPKVVYEVEKSKATSLATRFLNELPVHDVDIEESRIEDIIRDVFTNKKVSA